jgi:periplasmic copper chaperone A
MTRAVTTFLASLSILLIGSSARAHISVASGPGFANATQEITFGVGHGCEGLDTYTVKIDIPASVTSVRALPGDFGKATAQTDAAGLVTSVTWQRRDADLLDVDTNYYKLVLRLKVPNQPFTRIFFPAHQTCKNSAGMTKVVDWVATGAIPDGGMDEPAPALNILPARVTGWNKFTVTAAVTDLAGTFGDALIVWKGTAAYSSNPNTAALIKTTSGVTALSSLAANDEIWVKY